MKLQQTIHALCLSLVIFLTGCGLPSSQVPTDHYYRLPQAQVAKKAEARFERILIRPVQVQGLYHERTILYVEQQSPLEIKRYNYHYWVETPARLVQKHIKRYLKKSAIATTVTTTTSHQQASVEITPIIVGFERVVDGDQFNNLVSLQFEVRYADTEKELWSKTYKALVESTSSSMHTTAAGFGQALDQIMAQLLSELAGK